MTKKEALQIIKERYFVNQTMIEDPYGDFDRFIARENEALLIAIEALGKELNNDSTTAD